MFTRIKNDFLSVFSLFIIIRQYSVYVLKTILTQDLFPKLKEAISVHTEHLSCVNAINEVGYGTTEY